MIRYVFGGFSTNFYLPVWYDGKGSDRVLWSRAMEWLSLFLVSLFLVSLFFHDMVYSIFPNIGCAFNYEQFLDLRVKEFVLRGLFDTGEN
jgi:hypothetical protein